MRILMACEESQAITTRFRSAGQEAYSCDIQPCSGGHPEWHIQQDVTEILMQPWDMVIGFPPCTDLAVSGARHFATKKAEGRQPRSIEFFMLFTKLDPVPQVAIENPVGIMSTLYRNPDQIIQPYEFGDDVSKSTCLWLKGLPRLTPTNYVSGKPHVTRDGRHVTRWGNQNLECGGDLLGWNPDRARVRSKTYPGIADAIVSQWCSGEVVCVDGNVSILDLLGW